MVKTTINLDDEIYKKLIKEAVEKYGKTRAFSKLINEKLKEAEKIAVPKKEELKSKKSVVEEAFGIWGRGESGKEYVRRIREESEKRLKRMGL